MKSIIIRLAGEFGGPVFTPHVTLLSLAFLSTEEPETVLTKKMAAFAVACAPFSLALGLPAVEDRYFRSLYLRVQEKESMTALHRRAAEAFSVAPDAEYVPHLSLLYGNYSQERKEERTTSLDLQGTDSFQVDQVNLWKTEGEVADWIRIASFNMGNL